ncbi:MAG: DEAD/DEAH box helicase, partial [Cellvibrionaceae bacterium]|nr:DEAD/DEAH box helicase [Cellvibrionaceae bacterium]
MIAAIAQQQALPIAEVLSTLAEALATHDTVILQAPPGAGKTTIVPLMTLEQPWLGDKNILMLEPRRLAARAAAERMSALIQQPLGQTVGYRVRQEAKVSAQTRIEVLTEGLFVRRLQSEPELEGIGLLIFDEFHERHLDGDLALALVQQARELFCEDIKILLMSATLDNESLQAHFPGAPLICSEGKQFPVELHYSPKPQRDLLGPNNFRLAQAMLASIDTAMALDPGSLLCFLPGQGEIKRCAELLQQRFQTRRDKQGQELVIVPL